MFLDERVLPIHVRMDVIRKLLGQLLLQLAVHLCFDWVGDQ